MTHRETERRVRELQQILQRQLRCSHRWTFERDEHDKDDYHLQCVRCGMRATNPMEVKEVKP